MEVVCERTVQRETQHEWKWLPDDESQNERAVGSGRTSGEERISRRGRELNIVRSAFYCELYRDFVTAVGEPALGSDGCTVSVGQRDAARCGTERQGRA